MHANVRNHGMVLILLNLFSFHVCQAETGEEDAPTETIVSEVDYEARLEAVMHAAEHGQIGRIRSLLKEAIDVNDKDDHGQTAVMKAAENGHVAMVITLLLLGADVNAQDKSGQTAIMLSAQNGRSRVISSIKRLEDAGDAKAIQRLGGIDQSVLQSVEYVRVHTETLAKDDKGETALMKAAAAGHAEAITAIESLGWPNPKAKELRTARDAQGRTAAMHAIVAGRIRLLETFAAHSDSSRGFLSADALALRDEEGKTALDLARASKQDKIVNLLNEHLDRLIDNASSSIRQHGHLKTGFMIYQSRGDAYAAKGNAELASKDWAEAKRLERLWNDTSAALLEFSEKGNLAAVLQLVGSSYATQVNVADDAGQTPLIKASAAGHADVAVTLVGFGADVNVQDLQGCTAVMHAAEHGHTDVVSKLFQLQRILSKESFSSSAQEALADLTGTTKYSFTHAKPKRDVKFDLTLRDKQGRTALMHAIANNRLDFLQRMMESKRAYTSESVDDFFDMNVMRLADDSGKAPLALAQASGSKKIVELLQKRIDLAIRQCTQSIDRILAQGAIPSSTLYQNRAYAYEAIGEIEKATADLKEGTR